MNNFIPVDKVGIRVSPKHVQRVYHWIRLLDFKVGVLKDQTDGSYIFIFVTKNLPDLIFGIDASGTLATIYSNILTELQDIPMEKSNEFLKSSLKLQLGYPRLRINILDSENEPVRVMSNYKLRNLNMEFFAELMLEGMDYLAKLNDLIVEFELPEVWRVAEGEENEVKLEEKNQYSIFNQYF